MVGTLRVFRRDACEPIHHARADLEITAPTSLKYSLCDGEASPYRVRDTGTSMAEHSVANLSIMSRIACHRFTTFENIRLAFMSSSFRCFWVAKVCLRTLQSRLARSRANNFLVGRLMQRPSLVRLMVTIVGLAVGISLIVGKPPADTYHKGLRQTHIVANR